VHPRARLLLLLLLLVALSGCATRSQRSYVAATAVLPERQVGELVAAWQSGVCRYVDREGNGDPAVLAETRALRSPDVLRPARVIFGVLGVDADPAGSDGWDVQGVLVGRQASGGVDRYVFVVGIVARAGDRPVGIQDIRLVGLSAQNGTLKWDTGPADATAVQRYRDAFLGGGAIRFPGDTDNFRMTVGADRVSVRELGSGAEWRLQAPAERPSRRDRQVIPVLSPAEPGPDRRCKPAGS
jgi:hypothetical protein